MPFYLQSRHIAEYYAWCKNDYIVLNLSLTLASLKISNILFNRGEMITFSSVVASLEECFGKGTLRAAHHLEFNSLTPGSEESVEQWSDRVMETAQYVLEARVSWSVLQEQPKMRFAFLATPGPYTEYYGRGSA